MNDERKRGIIFPVRVVKEFGNIQNAKSLLAEKELQIGLSEPECVTLENGDSEEKAGILLDFGKELNASVRLLTHLTFTAEPAKVHITCGESVSEALGQIGRKNATNDHAIRDTDYLLPSYSDITLNESGFRFVCIRLQDKNAKLTIKSVVAVAVYRDIPYIGSFSCSNDVLNKIYNTAAYTCHLCLQNYIWDGIKRDRLVWVGDMHPEMLTVKSVFGNIPLMAETLSFIRNATPLPGWMNYYPTYSLWWLIIVRDWYFYTGEENFLNENKEYILNLTKQVIDTVNCDGSDNLKTYFLDWPTNETEAGVQGSRALLVMALDAAAQLAEFCNENELSAECKSKADILRTSKWNMNTAKQTLAVTALAKCCNAEEAAEKILEGGAIGFSTFMSYYLLKTAAKKDMTATLNVLEEYYGAMLSLGATSFWEDFNIEWAKNASPIDREPLNNESDIHGDNGAFCYKGFRHSLCHGWASAPTAFLVEDVLGINILSKGCKKIGIKPNLGNLSWAKGEYPTPLGVVTVSCVKKQDGSIKTEWTAPDGIEIVCE